MADKQQSFRFSIRDLLLVTAGLAVWLVLWKSQEFYQAISLTITLIFGLLLWALLFFRPIKNWKTPLTTCALLNVCVVGPYFVIGMIRDSHRSSRSGAFSFGIERIYYLDGREEMFSTLFTLGWLIILAGFTFCYANLLWHAIRPRIAALLLLLNVGLLMLIFKEMFLDSHIIPSRVSTLQGYLLALALLATPGFFVRLSRWLDSLPTTREEIQETLEEDESTPDK